MTTSVKPGPTSARTRTANDRFKSGWDARVGFATILAVAIHAAALSLSPSWELLHSTPAETRWEGMSLVALPPLDGLTGSTGAGAAALPILAEDEEESEERDGLDQGAVIAAADAEPVELWDAIGERLRRRGALVPSIAQPEADESAEGEEGQEGEREGEDPAVGGDAQAIDLPDLPEPGSLELDRLSALRPELALQSPSAWVLIRNPTEVEAFLRRGYLQGTLDPAVRGSVSVTLWIDQRGAVQWAEVSESSGRLDLDEYALALFNEVAAFKAAREDGVSVSRSVTLSVNFPW